MQGLIGKKIGMTQIFGENGEQIPVTVLQAGPCVVVQRKTKATDGYSAVQLGYGDQKEQRLNKPMQGHLKKYGATPKRVLREFGLSEEEELKEGEVVDAAIFDGVTFLDITGLTKGRGFQGVVKRYGMKGGRASHGSSNHRTVGSIGQCTRPSRVFKNKKMPGHMGNKHRTVQNLKVVQLREKENVILVRGAVPGPTGGLLSIRKALKKT